MPPATKNEIHFFCGSEVSITVRCFNYTEVPFFRDVCGFDIGAK